MISGKIHVEMISVPFNYYYSPVKVAVVREAGPCWLDREIGEAAIRQGYAVPFNPAASVPEIKKTPKPKRRRKAAAKADPETFELDDDQLVYEQDYERGDMS